MLRPHSTSLFMAPLPSAKTTHATTLTYSENNSAWTLRSYRQIGLPTFGNSFIARIQVARSSELSVLEIEFRWTPRSFAARTQIDTTVD
jgi:hypothetical protein